MAHDDAVAGLWAMAHLGIPMAVRVAATLRIADHIASGVRTAPELAELVNADADALDRLMRFLAARGVLSRDDAGRYALTAKGEPLRDDHPASLRYVLDIDGVGRAELSFVRLLDSIRTGEAAFPLHFGRTFWEDKVERPELTESFNRWMGTSVPERSPEIVSGYDWASLRHVVDVGGGNGSLLIALLTAYPSLRGTVFDIAATAGEARDALAAAGVADRGEAVTGSFFDPVPAGAGGYVLSLVLHDWNDEAATAILRRCAEAAGADGKVFVIENVGADGESPPTGMDMRMLAYFGGKERGVTDLGTLALAAGLKVSEVHPAGALSIVELIAA